MSDIGEPKPLNQCSDSQIIMAGLGQLSWFIERNNSGKKTQPDWDDGGVCELLPKVAERVGALESELKLRDEHIAELESDLREAMLEVCALRAEIDLQNDVDA